MIVFDSIYPILYYIIVVVLSLLLSIVLIFFSFHITVQYVLTLMSIYIALMIGMATVYHTYAILYYYLFVILN